MYWTTHTEIYPAFYSPLKNINTRFTVFKAHPFDGCSPIAEPDDHCSLFTENHCYPYLLVINGDGADCGLRKRIQMAKNAGVKGAIILSSDLNSHNETYADFSDNSFLLFIADASKNPKLLQPTKWMTVNLLSDSPRSHLAEL
jgi:hypothetical protein